ncbi:T7SS effector LXG polymorphic toxin, partial [Bacillus velezensis]
NKGIPLAKSPQASKVEKGKKILDQVKEFKVPTNVKIRVHKTVTADGATFPIIHADVKTTAVKDLGVVKMVGSGSGNSKKLFGQNGTQIASKTTWQNGKTERIDIENPNPGQREGQIHYHEPNNKKWYFDVETKKFYDQKTGEDAPSKIQKVLKDKSVQKAINKGLKFLGEDPVF